MRIVSLLPSATEIVFALGLGDELVGRTHECDYPPEAASVPVMTSDVGAEPDATSRRIHDRVRGQLHGGSAIYRLDEAALAAAEPDLILTQELCDVCAVSYREVTEAVRRIDAEISVVSLEPRSIEGILNTISTVGAMADAEDEAVGLIEILRERLGAIENRVLERRLAGVAPRRVVCLEWLDPPFASGHWVPEQVRRAGGWELLGREGRALGRNDLGRPSATSIPSSCCSSHVASTPRRRRANGRGRRSPTGSTSFAPFATGEVHALDGSAYFSRPGPRVIDGVGLLAEVMDPDGFLDEAPPHGWIPLAV